MTPREQLYPSPRTVLEFETWLHGRLEGEWGDAPRYLVDEIGHSENRMTYVEYLLWVWEEPRRFLVERYDANTIGRWLQQVGHPYASIGLPYEFRMRFWTALGTLFQDCFQPLVSDALVHRSETNAATKDLDQACYMWWEASPYYPSLPGLMTEDHERFLDVCRLCLNSGKAALQESALHGLGHALGIDRPLLAARDVVDEFLRPGSFARPELLKYAKRARAGSVR